MRESHLILVVFPCSFFAATSRWSFRGSFLLYGIQRHGKLEQAEEMYNKALVLYCLESKRSSRTLTRPDTGSGSRCDGPPSTKDCSISALLEGLAIQDAKPYGSSVSVSIALCMLATTFSFLTKSVEFSVMNGSTR